MTVSRDEILARLREENCFGRPPPGGYMAAEWPEDYSLDVEDAAAVVEEFIKAAIEDERERCLVAFQRGWPHMNLNHVYGVITSSIRGES